MVMCPLISSLDKQIECIKCGCAFLSEVTNFEPIAEKFSMHSEQYSVFETFSNSKYEYVTRGYCAIKMIALSTTKNGF